MQTCPASQVLSVKNGSVSWQGPLAWSLMQGYNCFYFSLRRTHIQAHDFWQNLFFQGHCSEVSAPVCWLAWGPTWFLWFLTHDLPMSILLCGSVCSEPAWGKRACQPDTVVAIRKQPASIQQQECWLTACWFLLVRGKSVDSTLLQRQDDARPERLQVGVSRSSTTASCWNPLQSSYKRQARH